MKRTQWDEWTFTAHNVGELLATLASEQIPPEATLWNAESEEMRFHGVSGRVETLTTYTFRARRDT